MALPPGSLDLVGRVLTPVAEVPRSRVSVRDGRIAAIRPWDGAAPAGALDAGDGWIIPGLIDAQINGAHGQDFSDPRADVGLAARGLLAQGVTAFVPTLVTLPWGRYPAALANLARAQPGGAAAVGIHLEGPFLQPRYRGAHPAEHMREPRPADLDALLALGPVRMLTLAPELPGALDAVRRLAAAGVVVSLGHSAASYDQGRQALLNGARAGTHLFNAMPPLHHRDPGLVGALLDDARAVVGIIPDGIHLHPAILRLIWQTRGTARTMLITDAIAAAGMPPGEYPLGERAVRTTRREARTADGTLAGSVLTLDGAIRGMVQLGVCPLTDAVAMASLTPARLLGLDAERGAVAVGRRGDLAILGPDLTVRATVLGGAVAYLAGA